MTVDDLIMMHVLTRQRADEVSELVTGLQESLATSQATQTQMQDTITAQQAEIEELTAAHHETLVLLNKIVS